ncbi:endonuclease/exonuclease/phosphatase family protein [Solwaraspora sp. WMMD1047]|uniref:endonuclease/exonuclease/phosphatase family protein n=1 Tax=Solwaraspora sp. WMMD1047 TaxID=3016102 RepID=UPI002416534B|nr:endonuclease/exonuclease/phosphatase family protein [Solwaraspora sp. WMMD1047]MDG4832224.1 endonuclease/exonuclease/phosphatase family protein [Solwaraspora sp. WMMD1047]
MIESGDGARLRVLSYNVHGQRDDVAALASVVRAAAPDVVIVQEGPRRFRWRHHSAALADRLGLVVVAGGLPALGNLLLANLRVRVHHTWCQRFPLTPGRHLRGAAFADCSVGALDAGGGPAGPGAARFVVAGTHLSTDPAERPGQAALFRRELAEVKLPLIAGADLNDEPAGAAWRTVAAGLVDTAVAAGRDDRLTYSCGDPRRRIDAIFVDPRIEIVDYDVVDTPQTRRASDHFPVLVDLVLPPG